MDALKPVGRFGLREFCPGRSGVDNVMKKRISPRPVRKMAVLNRKGLFVNWALQRNL